MIQLEQTLIANARQEHEQAAEYYQKWKSGKASGFDYDEYLRHYHALAALVSMAHAKDAGLSLDAARQLRDIEDEHAAAYREYAAPNLPDDV
jgi:hypothetical protein